VLKVAVNEDFSQFVTELEPRLRRVLTAHLGIDMAEEATADALSYAWEHWEQFRDMANPGGYLYRMAVRRARRRRPIPPVLPPEACATSLPDYEPRLEWALAKLTDRQRVAVLLVHGWGWPLVQAARFMNLSESSLRTHAARGLSRLRSLLEVTADAES